MIQIPRRGGTSGRTRPPFTTSSPGYVNSGRAYTVREPNLGAMSVLRIGSSGENPLNEVAYATSVSRRWPICIKTAFHTPERRLAIQGHPSLGVDLRPLQRIHGLVGQVADRLKEVIQQTAAGREWDVIALEIMPDHVHLFASPPPTVSPADLVKVFKGVSARILLKEFPDLAKRTGRGTLWAPSYVVGSAGNVSAETIKRYIEAQTERG